MSMKRGFLIFLLICPVLLVGCASRAVIAVHDVSEIGTSEFNFEPVANVAVSELAASSEGYWLVSLRTEINLERIVEEKNMAFLYYNVRNCGSDANAPDLYSAPVYVDRNERRSTASDYIYLALIPRDYRGAIERYTATFGNPIQEVVGGLCIGLGAGNMAGQHISTNYVSVELHE